MADDRTYIKLHDGMPGHPKVRGLSDKAFRTLVRAWCYCSAYLTDGEVVAAVARDLGTAKAWTELVLAGLAEDCPGGYLMHDYLEHQRSSGEVAEIKAGRGAGGTFGNHIRWHVARRLNDPKCKHCNPDEVIAPRSQDRSDSDSQGISHPDRSRSQSQRERERELSSKTSRGGAAESNAREPAPPRFPDHCPQHANVAVPGNCGNCKDTREANAAARPSLTVVSSRPPWCHRCDEWTRLLETPVGVMRCPECHPLAEEAS